MDIWAELRTVDIPDDRPITRAVRTEFLKACDQSSPNAQDAIGIAVGMIFGGLAELEGELSSAKDRLKKIEDTGITKPLPPGF